MSKKMLTVLLAVVLFGFFGCATVEVCKIPPKPVTQEVVVTVKSEGAGTLDLCENEEDEVIFEGLASRVGDTVFFTVWSYISSNDTLQLWKTINIMKHKGLSNLHVYINSGGGSAFAGLGICDVLLAAQIDGIHVTTEANGIVASAAVPIFVVGERRIATSGTIFMIHEATLFKFIAEEKMSDLLAQTRMMQMLEDRYNGLIADRSKLSVDELASKSAKTTWFSAAQALEWGLVDEIK